MAKPKTRQPVELVSIPSLSILRAQLDNLVAETRRLRVLIRMAKELERIEDEATNADAGHQAVGHA